MDLLERVRIAYKKLKANVYLDKTQLPLRNRIVLFEDDKKADERFRQIEKALSGGDRVWENYQEKLLRSVGAFVCPKKL